MRSASRLRQYVPSNGLRDGSGDPDKLVLAYVAELEPLADSVSAFMPEEDVEGDEAFRGAS